MEVFENIYKKLKEMRSHLHNKLKDVNRIQYFLNRTENQIEEEKEMLNNAKLCKLETKNDYKFIETLKIPELAMLLRERIYDNNLFNFLRCTCNMIIDTSIYSSDEESKESLRMKVNQMLLQPMKIGADSVNGFAFKTMLSNPSFKDVNKAYRKKIGFFVIKCPRNRSKSPEMIHEVVICLNALNNLRSLNPPVVNFSQCYDSFKCGLPIVGKDNNVLNYCSEGSDEVDYAIYESVFNPKPFGNLDTYEETINYSLMTFLALRKAQKLYKFTHNDLHIENNLLMDYRNEPFYCPHEFKGRVINVKSPTGKIPMMIDYGMSYAEIDGRKIGILDKDGYFDAVGIERDEPNFIGDPYKLVCMTAIFTEKNGVFKACKDIFSYFCDGIVPTDNEFEKILQDQWDFRFNIPNYVIKSLKLKWDIDELIEHTINLSLRISKDNVMFEKPTNLYVLGEDRNKEKITVETISSKSNYSVSLFDLYTSKGNINIANDFKRNKDRAFKNTENEFKELSKRLERKPRQINFPKTETGLVSHSDLVSSYVSSFSSYLDFSIRLKDLLKEYVYGLEILNEERAFLDVIQQKYHEVVHELIDNEKYIYNLKNTLTKIVYGSLKNEYSDRENERAKEHKLYETEENLRNAYGMLEKFLKG